MVAGGLAYRLGKIGVFSFSSCFNMPLLSRGLAPVIGLACEAAAFQGSERVLQNLRGERVLYALRGRSFFEDWRSSFIDFGILKGMGHLFWHQSILVQHLFQDISMVMGHQATAFLDWTPVCQGSLLEQMAQAEITNLQLGAGAALFALGSGHRLHHLERNLEQECKNSPQNFFKLPRETFNFSSSLVYATLSENISLGNIDKEGPLQSQREVNGRSLEFEAADFYRESLATYQDSDFQSALAPENDLAYQKILERALSGELSWEEAKKVLTRVLLADYIQKFRQAGQIMNSLSLGEFVEIYQRVTGRIPHWLERVLANRPSLRSLEMFWFSAPDHFSHGTNVEESFLLMRDNAFVLERLLGLKIESLSGNAGYAFLDQGESYFYWMPREILELAPQVSRLFRRGVAKSLDQAQIMALREQDIWPESFGRFSERVHRALCHPIARLYHDDIHAAYLGAFTPEYRADLFAISKILRELSLEFQRRLSTHVISQTYEGFIAGYEWGQMNYYHLFLGILRSNFYLGPGLVEKYEIVQAFEAKLQEHFSPGHPRQVEVLRALENALQGIFFVRRPPPVVKTPLMLAAMSAGLATLFAGPSAHAASQVAHAFSSSGIGSGILVGLASFVLGSAFTRVAHPLLKFLRFSFRQSPGLLSRQEVSAAIQKVLSIEDLEGRHTLSRYDTLLHLAAMAPRSSQRECIHAFEQLAALQHRVQAQDLLEEVSKYVSEVRGNVRRHGEAPARVRWEAFRSDLSLHHPVAHFIATHAFQKIDFLEDVFSGAEVFDLSHTAHSLLLLISFEHLLRRFCSSVSTPRLEASHVLEMISLLETRLPEGSLSFYYHPFLREFIDSLLANSALLMDERMVRATLRLLCLIPFKHRGEILLRRFADVIWERSEKGFLENFPQILRDFSLSAEEISVILLTLEGRGPRRGPPRRRNLRLVT